MAQVFNASLSVTLPDEPGAMAKSAAVLIGTWAELLEKLDDGTGSNSDLKSQFSINETRVKSAVANPTVRRGRKPRQTPAELSLLHPSETGGDAA